MRDDKGQALALGVFGLLFLAIGMYMVASFGRHVHQKVHVQTTADAMALSLAQLEAQSFNYIAFANRAQVAHYVTLMNLQAYVSYASSLEQFMLVWASVMQTVENLAQACSFAPWVGPFCSAMADVAGALKQPLFELYKVLNKGVIDSLDNFVGLAGPGLETLNKALWVSEMAMAYMVWFHLQSGGQEVFQSLTRENDRTWANTPVHLAVNIGAGAFNVRSYAKAFDPVSGFRVPLVPWPSSEMKLEPGRYDGPVETIPREVQRAQRIMTEVVNATRFDYALLKRSLIPRVLIGSGGELNTLQGVGDFLRSAPILKDLVGRLGGESKLVGPMPAGRGTPIDAIFSATYGVGTLSRGEVMASTDEWIWSKGSVWSKAGSQPSSKHCRAQTVESIPGLSLDMLRKAITGEDGFQWLEPSCKDHGQGDRNHVWSGISPYMLYQAGNDDKADNPGGAFHQPSVFVWAHKNQAQAGLEHAISFRWKTNKRSEVVDTRTGQRAPQLLNQLLGNVVSLPDNELTGVHAFARAEPYYHRPGNWAEPPNLFNPFWRARLAPVIDSRELAESEVFATFAALLKETLIFH